VVIIIITVHDYLSLHHWLQANFFLSPCSLGDKSINRSLSKRKKRKKAHPIRYHLKLNNIRPETHVNGKKKTKKKKKKKKRGRNKENPKLKAKFSNIRSSLTTASAMPIFSSRNQSVLSEKAWNDFPPPPSLSMKALGGVSL